MKNSTSIQSVWNTIRQHFGFQITGAHFIHFAEIHLEANERPEDLYQRFMAFLEDVLLKANSLSHHGDLITEDEELTPSLENFVVLTWLKLIHPELLKLVKQRYGTELRSRTLASIRPEVSQALNSSHYLMKSKPPTMRGSCVLHATNNLCRTAPAKTSSRRGMRSTRQPKTCPLCKQAGRPDVNHFLSKCRHLPEEDRKYIAKARQIANIFDDHLEEGSEIAPRVDDSELNDEISNLDRGPEPTALRIQTRQSPYIDTFHAHHPVRITVDRGATGNMINHSIVTRLGCHVIPSSQSADQADGSDPPFTNP